MPHSVNPFDAGYFETDELRTMGFGSVGENVKIARGTQMIGVHNIFLGNNVRIDGYCNFIAIGGPGIRLGSYIHIGAYSHFSGGGGGITMEDFSGLSQGVHIYSGSDDYSGNSLTNPCTPKGLKTENIGPVTLRRHVIVGSGAVILPGCDIGEGTAVGALALVTRSLKPWGIYAGSPAKLIKARSQKLLELEAEMMQGADA